MCRLNAGIFFKLLFVKRFQNRTPIIIGRQPIIEALEAGKRIEKIFIQRGATGDAIKSIKQLAKDRMVPFQEVPQPKLLGLTQGNHQGVVALAGLINYYNLQDVIDQVVEKGESPLIVVLDGITDVRNIGAIARSAFCCGAHAIVVPLKNSATINEEAVKASAGALEKIPVCRTTNIEQALETLQLNGIRIASSVMDTDVKTFDVDWKDPIAVVMGGEGEGIANDTRKKSDVLFTIPMAAKFDSFNVSVATGIILYEAMKQRLFN